METVNKKSITVEVTIDANIEKVWELWIGPHHIMHWNGASEEWHTTYATNDLRPGGTFLSRMEAKDGSVGFDFSGEYTWMEPYKQLGYILEDGRKVQVRFKTEGKKTIVTEHFDPETTHSHELQRAGWQAILNNFKKYAEESDKRETLHFETRIDAPAVRVYETMLDDQHYREWTKPFNPTSRFIGKWEKGSKIHFLGTGENGEEGGMVSFIKENLHGKFVSIAHAGILHKGEEVFDGPDVDKWKGFLENYTFKEISGTTLLSIDTDTPPEYVDYFLETWPIALQVLKEICEQ